MVDGTKIGQEVSAIYKIMYVLRRYLSIVVPYTETPRLKAF